jgi:glutamate synthase (ferredoxin)
MRWSKACLLGLSAPVVAYAFLPQSARTPVTTSVRTPQAININTEIASKWSQDQGSFTQLNMAFETPQKGSNMFDGPMALTQERDACGVGFIANTQSGGTI